jgi:hypothetical protein
LASLWSPCWISASVSRHLVPGSIGVELLMPRLVCMPTRHPLWLLLGYTLGLLQIWHSGLQGSPGCPIGGCAPAVCRSVSSQEAGGWTATCRCGLDRSGLRVFCLRGLVPQPYGLLLEVMPLCSANSKGHQPLGRAAECPNLGSVSTASGQPSHHGCTAMRRLSSTIS